MHATFSSGFDHYWGSKLLTRGEYYSNTYVWILIKTDKWLTLMQLGLLISKSYSCSCLFFLSMLCIFYNLLPFYCMSCCEYQCLFVVWFCIYLYIQEDSMLTGSSCIWITINDWFCYIYFAFMHSESFNIKKF